ncbi:MAG: exodeoxyribonuclease VII large subunit, partial [Peptococcaceae bacterium]|nr:exodeoxyribonuclease VII large subunit [Peptococcaceae bacterium]
PDGLGSVHLALEQLKAKLTAEGLFEIGRKRRLPLLPATVGIATSITGAALHDMLKVIYRRFPNAQVVISPCAVQGQDAPHTIAKAIELLNQLPQVEVIIVGRGGGSREELWAFNSEVVVRAIVNSRTPVISAVGHETDITLADLAADLRAPTPSAAAELAVPVKNELYVNLTGLQKQLLAALQNKLNQKRRVSELLAASPALRHPLHRINQERQFVDQLYLELQQNITGFINNKNAILNLLGQKLDAMSPLKVLGRGYSICQKSDGIMLKDAAEVRVGEAVTVILTQGKLACTVQEVDLCRNQ